MRIDRFRVAPVVAIISQILSLILLFSLWPETNQGIIAQLSFNKTTALCNIAVVLSSLFCILLSMSEDEESPRSPIYYFLISTCTLASCVLVCSSDLVVSLISLSITLMSFYAIVWMFSQDISNLIAILVAIAFFAFGLAFVFGSLGSTSLDVMAMRAAQVAQSKDSGFFLFGISMTLIALFFVSALTPFHSWIFSVNKKMPLSVSLFTLTTLRIATIVACMRVAIHFASAAPNWHGVLWVMAVASMLFGTIAAIRQEDIKDLITYLSLAQTGFILSLMPSVASDPQGAWRAFIIYIFVYVFSVAGSFAFLGCLPDKKDGQYDINLIAGLARKKIFLAIAFMVFLATIGAIWPTLGFFGRAYLFLNLLRGGDIALAIVGTLTSVIMFYCFARLTYIMIFRTQIQEAEKSTPSFTNLIVLSTASAFILTLGIWPDILLAFVRGSVV